MEDTALHISAFSGNSEMCRLLIDNGIDIHARNKANICISCAYDELTIPCDDTDGVQRIALRCKYGSFRCSGIAGQQRC
jgi:ankyrin repeat protein